MNQDSTQILLSSEISSPNKISEDNSNCSDSSSSCGSSIYEVREKQRAKTRAKIKKRFKNVVRRCKPCNTVKDIHEFDMNISRNNFRYHCKACRREQRREEYNKKKNERDEYKECNVCNKILHIENFQLCRKSCKECQRQKIIPSEEVYAAHKGKMKDCMTCKKNLPSTLFEVDKNRLRNKCKVCRSEQRRKNYTKKKKISKECHLCHQTLPVENFRPFARSCRQCQVTEMMSIKEVYALYKEKTKDCVMCEKTLPVALFRFEKNNFRNKCKECVRKLTEKSKFRKICNGRISVEMLLM